MGQFPDAPAEMLRSMEADVYPKNHQDRWELIDGVMGELSPFHDTFGYYAQGVQEGTAVLPRGWRSRLIPILTAATFGATGLCLEVHDLLIAKYVANPEKDRAFARVAIHEKLADIQTLLERVRETEIPSSQQAAISEAIRADSIA